MIEFVYKRRQRKPSDYQKQIRFLTIMSMTVGIGLVVVLLWLVNRSVYANH